MLNILEGEAALAHVRIDVETGEPELDLLTVADGSVVTLPREVEGLDDEVLDSLLGIGGIIVLGGQEAIDQVIETGDLDAGLEVGRSTFAGDDDNEDVVSILADFSDFIDFERDENDEIVLIQEDELEDIEVDLRSGTIDNGFIEDFILADEDEDLRDLVKNSIDIDVVPAVTALGELPDSVDEFVLEFLDEFEPPKAEELYDQDGDLIGIKEPDQVVFDENGLPIGKQLGDLYAVDEDGNIDEDGEIPDLFFLEDPYADDGFSLASFVDLLPTGVGERDDQGKAEDWVPSLVAFDKEGDIVHTIFEFDDQGNLIGTKAFDDQFVDENGDPLDQPVLQFLNVDEGGDLIGQHEISFVVADDQGELHEFVIPDPVAYDDEGNAVGLQLPSVILLDENGRPEGLEIADIVAKEFFEAIDFLKADHDIEDFEDYLFDDDDILFDAEGLAQTIDQFRPSEIIRDEDGEIVGHKIATKLTCITSDCYQDFGDDEESLAKLKEAVRVLIEGDEGDFIVAEIKGTDLRDEDGEFIGFLEAEALLFDENSGHAKGFLEGVAELLGEFGQQDQDKPLEIFDDEGNYVGTFDFRPDDSDGHGDFSLSDELKDKFLPDAIAFLTANIDEFPIPEFEGFSVTDLEDFDIGEAFGGEIDFDKSELIQLFEERPDHSGPDEEFVKKIAEEFGLSPNDSEEDRALLKDIIDDLKDDRKPPDDHDGEGKPDDHGPDLDFIRDIVDELGLDPEGNEEDRALLRDIIEDLKEGERPADFDRDDFDKDLPDDFDPTDFDPDHFDGELPDDFDKQPPDDLDDFERDPDGDGQGTKDDRDQADDVGPDDFDKEPPDDFDKDLPDDFDKDLPDDFDQPPDDEHDAPLDDFDQPPDDEHDPPPDDKDDNQQPPDDEHDPPPDDKDDNQQPPDDSDDDFGF